MSDALPKFDVVVGGDQPLVQEIVAAEVYGAPTLLSVPLTEEKLEQLTGKRVLVCGSYLTRGELLSIDIRASFISLQPYSQKEVDALKELGGDFEVKRFHIDTERFPRALRLMRHVLQPGADYGQDKHFYNGLMTFAFGAKMSHEEAIRKWLKEGVWENDTEMKFILDGMTISVEHKRLAQDIAKGAIEVRRGDKVLRVVEMAGKSLVMHVAEALLEDKKTDIAVVVHVMTKWNMTETTYYTRNSDLTWVCKAPFWGGGLEDNCKHTLSQGISFQRLIERIKNTPDSVPASAASAIAAE